MSNRVACGIVGRIARQVPARISDGRAGRQCEHHGHNGGLTGETAHYKTKT